MNMETVENCPVCGDPRSTEALSPLDHTVSKHVFHIRECAACGFRFTSPRPTQEKIGAYYLSEDYISHAAKATTLRDHLYRWVRRRTIKGKHKLVAQSHPTGAVLDIGCGSGDFLAFLKSKGYSAQGVEVSPQARGIATGKGLDVVASIDELPAGNSYDVITLWHVLEHVPSPKETLAKLHTLAKDGALLVIAVPDRSSWDAQHYGAEWAAWDVPRHLSHFRREDLRKLLAAAGFELHGIRNMWFDAPYVAMLSEQYRGAGSLGSLIRGATVGLWSNAVARLSGRPTSSSLYLAKKAKRP